MPDIALGLGYGGDQDSVADLRVSILTQKIVNK